MSNPSLDLIIAGTETRELQWPDDSCAHFVRDSWLRSFRNSPFAGCVPNHIYWDTYFEAVESLMQGGATVTLLVAKDDPDTVIAWVCHESISGEQVVHYAFVKQSFRKLGVLNHLLAVLGIKTATLTFRSSPAFTRYRDRGWRWDPTLARVKRAP